MKETLTYRMMGLVPYNISPIQQAIQYGHAVVEYISNDYRVHGYISDPLLKWMDEDKTFIILNGGTTNKKVNVFGTLNQHCVALLQNKITFSTFHEPDLGDQLTAVVFLVDERVYDKEQYPDYPVMKEYCPNKYYDKWVENIGGPQNVFLREFLSQFKLA